jgi:hypothetical protein
MTDFAIAAVVPRVQFIADGTQTAFTVPFPLAAAEDLLVHFDDGAAPTAHVVSGLDAPTALLTFTAPPPAGTRLTCLRVMPLARATDFQEAGEFRAAAINAELDRLAMLVQQVDEKAGRAVRQKPTDVPATLDLPAPAPGYIRWNGAGTALILDPVPQDVAATAVASAGTAAAAASAASAGATAAAASADAAAASAAIYVDERKRNDLAALRERVRAAVGSVAVPQPSLALDFTQGRGLDWLQFTNASGGRAFFDDRGAMQVAAVNVARYDHAPLSGAPRGLLIEEQRSNEAWPSEDFTASQWTKDTGTAIVANAAAGLDGAMTAQRVDFGNLAGGVRRDLVVGNDTNTRTVSWFVKAGTCTSVVLRNTLSVGTTIQQDVTYNLAAGTCSAGPAQVPGPATNFGMVQLPNGWWRLYAAITNNASGSINLRLLIYATTTGNFFLDGVQCETGTFATPYIKTVSGAVTRAADIASLAAVASWAGAEGAVVADYCIAAPVLPSVNAAILALCDGTTANAAQLARNAGNGHLRADVTAASVSQAALVVAPAQASDTVHKAALAYRLNDVAALQNNGAAQTDASATIPGFTACLLGRAPSNGQVLNGWIRALAFWPRRVATTDLQTLTI